MIWLSFCVLQASDPAFILVSEVSAFDIDPGDDVELLNTA